MIAASRKLRSPLKWHGGKSYLARRIVALMPPHRTYVEPFVGGGSVLLNKPRASLEVAGDLDEGLINLWRCLKSPLSPLITLLTQVPYEQDRFDAAAALTGLSGTHGAIAFMVRNRMSRGGLGQEFAWSDRLRGGQPGDANAWDTIRAELPAIAERVSDVMFDRCDAAALIRAIDNRPDTLFYIDPPYLPATRSVPKAYRHEMTREQHEALLVQVQDCRGMVMLSGYRSPLYDEALARWRRVDFDMPNHSGQGKAKQRRTECVWMNYDPNHGGSFS